MEKAVDIANDYKTILSTSVGGTEMIKQAGEK
jgi:hypothetical protein